MPVLASRVPTSHVHTAAQIYRWAKKRSLSNTDPFMLPAARRFIAPWCYVSAISEVSEEEQNGGRTRKVRKNLFLARRRWENSSDWPEQPEEGATGPMTTPKCTHAAGVSTPVRRGRLPGRGSFAIVQWPWY